MLRILVLLSVFIHTFGASAVPLQVAAKSAQPESASATPLPSTSLNHVCDAATTDTYSYTYCIDSEPNSPNHDIVFAFHGAGDSSDWWHDGTHGQLMTAALAERIPHLPTFISISLGSSWLITELEDPALEDVMFTKIMPELEAKARTGPGRRLAIGLSMGGFNTSQIALKHPDYFDRVVLICPIMLAAEPFRGPDAVEKEISEHPEVSAGNYRALVQWLEFKFQTEAAWRQHDPLALIQTLKSTAPIYLTCGRQDQLDFFGGAEKFAKLAAERNLPVQWRPMDGRHCVYDTAEIAAFLYP